MSEAKHSEIDQLLTNIDKELLRKLLDAFIDEQNIKNNPGARDE